ncbi:MAG: cbb3-type cytochrome c oxidase subunit II [Bacteroidales bacterium]|nr:cbb3-type cytochrome c oxidase subunit II [Bacteroidales bacterium]
MNRGLMIFLGCVLTFSSAWLGLVVLPYWQLNNEAPYQSPGSATAYPQPPSAEVAAGGKVYQANGCLYCHSQQVRSQHFANGADIARGWGQRRNVSRDYIYDRPILLGTMRTGPDLAAIGERNASPSWHHEHLFNPRSKSDWSIMPSFSYLYERRKIENGQRSPTALTLGREWTVLPGKRYRPTSEQWTATLAADGEKLQQLYAVARPNQPLGSLTDPAHQDRLLTFWLALPEEEYEIVPKPAADQLVAYLIDLRKTSTPLPEAHEP